MLKKTWITAIAAVLMALLVMVVLGPAPTAFAVDAAQDPAGYLEEQGYTVTSVYDGKSKDTGKPYAMVTMDWESKDLWNIDTTAQTTQGFYALRLGYPKALTLYVDLLYSRQYEVIWRVNITDWDQYAKDKDWQVFSNAFWVGIWDNDAGAYMDGTELKTFVRKNFGSGEFAEPKFPSPTKAAAYGSVAIQADKTQVKLKGQIEVQVTVLDKQKNPVSKASVDLTVSGTALGSRTAPKSITTGDDGTATATFIAGSKDGAALITAQSRGTTGTLLIQVGKGDSDPGPFKVTQNLQQQGYKVNAVAKAADNASSVTVDMDLAGTVLDKNGKLDPETVTQVIDGWTALLDAYPQATLLTVLTRNAAYTISWKVKSADFKTYMDGKTADDAFWTPIWNAAEITDLKTNKPVAPKDFKP